MESRETEGSAPKGGKPMTAEERRELVKELKGKAKTVREKTIQLAGQAKSSHYGGSLSCVDILVTLYFHVLRVDPRHPEWAERDRFILSKGHAAASYCPVLALRGFFPEESLLSINHLNSPFGMHIDMRKIPGVEMSTGSLGHGLPVAVGMALADRLGKKDRRVLCLMGDAELNEGSVWEAAMSASHFKLGSLCAIIDRNGCGSDGYTEEVMAIEPLDEKWKAFGWTTHTINGHSIEALVDVFDNLPRTGVGSPTVVIAETVKGKGVSFLEKGASWHYGGLGEEDEKRAIDEIRGGGN